MRSGTGIVGIRVDAVMEGMAMSPIVSSNVACDFLMVQKVNKVDLAADVFVVFFMVVCLSFVCFVVPHCIIHHPVGHTKLELIP